MSRADVEITFGANFEDVIRRLDALERHMQGWGQTVRRLGIAAFAGWVGHEALQAVSSGVRRLTSFIQSAIGEAMEARGVEAKLESVIRATGGAAGKTVPQLKEMADQLERVTKIDDTQIKTVMSQMLAFPSVGGENFDRAIKAVLDTTALGFGTLESNAMQLAKALEYPATGLDGLSKSGVRFTEVQKELLKALVEVGRTAEAQEIILDAVEVGVKGASGAYADANKGVNSLRLAWSNFKEDIGQQLLPAYDALTGALNEKLAPVLANITKQFGDWAKGMDAGRIDYFTTAIANAASVVGDLAMQLSENLVPIMEGLVAAAENAINLVTGHSAGAAVEAKRQVGSLSEEEFQALLDWGNEKLASGQTRFGTTDVGTRAAFLRERGFGLEESEVDEFEAAISARLNERNAPGARVERALRGLPGAAEAAGMFGAGITDEAWNRAAEAAKHMMSAEEQLAKLREDAANKTRNFALESQAAGAIGEFGLMGGFSGAVGAAGTRIAGLNKADAARQAAIKQLLGGYTGEQFQSGFEDPTSTFKRIQAGLASDPKEKTAEQQRKDMLLKLKEQHDTAQETLAVEKQIRDKIGGAVAQ